MTITFPFSKGAAALIISLAVAFSALGLALAQPSTSSKTAGTVEVSGSGTATGSPDTLNIQLAVQTTASSAAAALNKNNAEMHHLQAVFVGAGVHAADLQTSGLDVSPVYSPNSNTISGYSAEDDLSATVHDVHKSGAIIDDAENAVGNDVSINGITFSFSNSAPLMARARVLAMQDARAQASDYAKGAGEHLGTVERITTSQQSPSPVPFAGAAASNLKAAATPVPIRTGTQTVSVSVDVVYSVS